MSAPNSLNKLGSLTSRIILYAVTSIFVISLAHAETKCEKVPQVEITQNAITINGHKTMLRAVSYSLPKSWDGSSIELAEIDHDLAAIKAAGFNAVRSYEPWPEEVLDLIELRSLYLVEAVVHIDDSTNFDSDEEANEVIARALSIVARDRCRPSIVLWSLWNDAPFNWGTSGGNAVSRYGYPVINSFLRRLYDAVKERNPERYITGANVLNARHAEVGMDVVDVIGVNAYLGIYDWLTQSYSQALAEDLVFRLKALSKKYGKPIWISEMGAASVPAPLEPTYFIPQQIELVQKGGFFGYSIFQWRDDWSKVGPASEAPFHIEANWGLLDARRQRKAGFRYIAAAVSGIKEQNPILAETRIAWHEIPSSPCLPAMTCETLDNFSYADSGELRRAYGKKHLGYAHAFLTQAKAEQDGRPALKIRFVPEDFGAWLLISRTLTHAIDARRFQNITVRLATAGAPMNVSVTVKLRDGRVFRSLPLLISNTQMKTYLLPLKGMLLDWVSNGHARIFDPTLLSLNGTVVDIGFRINDVANFEAPGVPAEILVEHIELRG